MTLRGQLTDYDGLALRNGNIIIELSTSMMEKQTKIHGTIHSLIIPVAGRELQVLEK